MKGKTVHVSNHDHVSHSGSVGHHDVNHHTNVHHTDHPSSISNMHNIHHGHENPDACLFATKSYDNSLHTFANMMGQAVNHAIDVVTGNNDYLCVPSAAAAVPSAADLTTAAINLHGTGNEMSVACGSE